MDTVDLMEVISLDVPLSKSLLSSQMMKLIVSLRNILCGSLHCDGGSIIYSNVNTRNSYTIYTRYVNNFECRSFTTSATVDEVSPGLVMDGSKCGNGSVSLIIVFFFDFIVCFYFKK